MAWFQKRFQAWLAARTPRSDSQLLTQRNIYIVPTRPGWMMGLTLLVMLVGSINYQLNLGYLLTFLLAGSAGIGLHVCHATLRGLTLRMQPPPPCFVGSAAHLRVSLVSEKRQPRTGIGLTVSGQPDWVWVDVPAQGQTTAEVGWEPTRRGLLELPTLVVETRYPLGLFRAWTVWRPAARLWAYPKPELSPPPLPPGQPKAGTGAPVSAATSGEYDGVRAYRRGDPLQSLVWKRVAQAMARGSADLVSRDPARAHQQHELWLDWHLAGTANPDLRASRLTAWLLQAERLGLDHGLRLPGITIEPGQGSAHRQRCLEALATC